jgi:hypothetical protein
MDSEGEEKKDKKDKKDKSVKKEKKVNFPLFMHANTEQKVQIAATQHTTKHKLAQQYGPQHRAPC